MKIEQRKWDKVRGWIPEQPTADMKTAQMVLIFGGKSLMKEKNLFQYVKDLYPQAHTFGCSTAGEICGIRVYDDTLVTTAIHFEYSQIKPVQVEMNQAEKSYQAGEFLANALPSTLPSLVGSGDDTLVHVLVLSEGLKVNASDLVVDFTAPHRNNHDRRTGW